MSLADIKPADAAALVGAAAVAVGAPSALAAALVALAPKLVPVLADLLTRHQAGEPLPAILRAVLPDDAALVEQLLEQALAEGDRETWPDEPTTGVETPTAKGLQP